MDTKGTKRGAVGKWATILGSLVVAQIDIVRVFIIDIIRFGSDFRGDVVFQAHWGRTPNHSYDVGGSFCGAARWDFFPN